MYGWRSKIGLITPIGENIEHAFHIYAPEGVSFTSTKIRFPGERAQEDLPWIERQLEAAAAVYKDSDEDLVFLGSTAGSYAGGPDWDQACTQIIEKASGKPALAVGIAEREALKALGCKKVAVLTPYGEGINRAGKQMLEDSGYAVSGIAGMDVSYVLREGRTLEACDEYLLYRNALKMDLNGADTFLLSGLALSTMEIVDELESALGLPVVTSQQAALWSVLRHCRIGATVPKMGALFTI